MSLVHGLVGTLLPFVGEAFSFLFGAVSENDLKNIKDNIQALSENQNKVRHVVEERPHCH